MLRLRRREKRKGRKKKVSQGQKQTHSCRRTASHLAIAPLRTHSKEKRDFWRQCITGQSSRLICVVIHLGFARQAEGGETEAATQNGFFVSVYRKVYVQCLRGLWGSLVGPSAACSAPDKGQLGCTSFQVQVLDGDMTGVHIQSNPYFLWTPDYVTE